MIIAQMVVMLREPDEADDSDCGHYESWGDYKFSALPAVGDSFIVWRNLERVRLVITHLSHEPVPVEFEKGHYPFWPAERTEPGISLTARRA